MAALKALHRWYQNRDSKDAVNFLSAVYSRTLEPVGFHPSRTALSPARCSSRTLWFRFAERRRLITLDASCEGLPG